MPIMQINGRRSGAYFSSLPQIDFNEMGDEMTPPRLPLPFFFPRGFGRGSLLKTPKLGGIYLFKEEGGLQVAKKQITCVLRQ